MNDGLVELQRARDEVLERAEGFRLELEPLLASALRRGIRTLSATQAPHVGAMDEPTRRAFERAVEDAIASAVSDVSERLRAPDLWLSPLVAPDLPGPRETGWSVNVPDWLARLLRRGEPEPIGPGALEDPGNRVWIAITGATTPIDRILHASGFEQERPRIGGGRFGVGPRTMARLDPAGTLGRRWKAYRAAYARYAALSRVRD